MHTDDWKNFLMILTTLVVAILSYCIKNPLAQILFMIIYVGFCLFIYSYLNNPAKFKIVSLTIICICELAILIFSIIDSGSIGDYLGRVSDFFALTQDTSRDGETVISNHDLKDYYNDLSAQIAELNNNLKESDSSINEKLDFFTGKVDSYFFNENVDENEVNSIIERIEKYTTSESNSFSGVRTDIYLIELLYKMHITEETYYYCNILKAFDEYGIDIEKFGLDERTLFIWDVETLYVTYNMKQANLDNLKSDEVIEEIGFTYNSNKVSMQKYSDNLDYGNWRRLYKNITAQEINNKLNSSIMAYYKKFKINFSID